MPLVYKIEQRNFKLGVWEINESEEFFIEQLGFCSLKKSSLQRLQYLAARLILKKLEPSFRFDKIRDYKDEKPTDSSNLFNFNLSHTGKYAVAMLSKTDSVGTDVEHISPKILKIQSRFLNTEEINLIYCCTLEQQTEVATLFWTVKETVLKRIGDRNFDYLNDITIDDFELVDNGLIQMRIKNYSISNLEIRYFKIQDYWLSYCI